MTVPLPRFSDFLALDCFAIILKWERKEEKLGLGQRWVQFRSERNEMGVDWLSLKRREIRGSEGDEQFGDAGVFEIFGKCIYSGVP